MLEEILESLRRLEARVTRLEENASLAPLQDARPVEPSAGDEDRDEALEIQIKQNDSEVVLVSVQYRCFKPRSKYHFLLPAA